MRCASTPPASFAPRQRSLGSLGCAASWLAAWPLAALRWVALCVAALSCQPALLPCRSSSHCGASTECLANRCVARGSKEPVAQANERIVLEPVQVAVVLNRVAPPAIRSSELALPPTVTFGGPGATERLLLRFGREWQRLDVEAAFLVLSAAPGAQPASGDIAVRVSSVRAPWPNGVLTEPPRTGPPVSPAIARTRPPSELRVDVTAMLGAGARSDASDHGFGIESMEQSELGATYLTGTDGPAPRLEVYGRAGRHAPARRERGAAIPAR